MNPYQIAGIIAGCTLVFAGVVALLAMQGLPLLLAFLLVYAVALVSMIGMQRRARSVCEDDAADDGAFAGDRDRTARAARAGRRAARVRDALRDEAGSASVRLDASPRTGVEPFRVAVGDVRY